MRDSRSKLGLSAAVAFLLSLPVAALADAFVRGGAELVIHVLCGLGFALLAAAVLNFRTPTWLGWLGSLASGALAVIFALQAVSNLVPNPSLHHIAFQILGQTPERVLPDVLIAWFVGLLITDSWGRSRALGWALMTPVVATEAAGYVSTSMGQSLYEDMPALKLVLLLPFVWLLCESAKPSRPEPSTT